MDEVSLRKRMAVIMVGVMLGIPLCLLAACGLEEHEPGPAAYEVEVVEEQDAAPGAAADSVPQGEEASSGEEPAVKGDSRSVVDVESPGQEASQEQGQTKAQDEPPLEEQASRSQPQTQKQAEPQAAPAQSFPSYCTNMLKQVNACRAQAGASFLKLDAALCKAAQARAAEMRASGIYEHTRPNGSSFFTIFGQYGISCSEVGENIAGGYASAAEACAALRKSPGHNRNLVNPAFSRLGVGLVRSSDGFSCWVQLFCD